MTLSEFAINKAGARWLNVSAYEIQLYFQSHNLKSQSNLDCLNIALCTDLKKPFPAKKV